jgi:DNA-binding NarL/FixJ family response regulator
MAEVIQVLLADDHPLVRAGIRATLATEPDLVPVGEAANGYEVQRLCRDLQPDVLVLDLSMPGPPPLAVVAYLREHCPAVSVLILTAYDDDAYVQGLAAAGVAGYVLKDEAPETVVHAIRTVKEGGTWFGRPVAAKLARPSSDGLATEKLTARERQILELLGRGWDNARIAAECQLREQTVRNYISRIYTKVGVQSRAEALVWAREQGLLAG